MTQQAGTAVVSPGITPRSAYSTVDVLVAPPATKPHGATLMTEVLPAELTAAGDVLAAPPATKSHGALLVTELPPAELSEARTQQRSISCASIASADTSPILDSSDSSLSSEGLETSEKSKPLSDKEELAVLREELAELYASIAEQAGDCKTFLDSPAASVLERGLFALERVCVSRGSSCA